MGLQVVNTRPQITLGAATIFTDLPGFKILQAYTTTANQYCGFRALGASSSYQVPVGKKYVLRGLRQINLSASVVFQSLILVDTTAATAYPGTAFGAGSSGKNVITPNLVAETAAELSLPVTGVEIAATKFIAFSALAANVQGVVYLYGTEENV